jgi:saccharopine dehydrogenase-like NADP-dependent oxidoreductase
MRRVLIIGGGQIGSLIAFLLANSNDYQIYLADYKPHNENLARLPLQNNLEIIPLDATDEAALDKLLKHMPVDVLVSCLPYYANIPAATAAKRFNLHYFDLTEDIQTTNAIIELAKNARQAFVPQCGLAPGFISIVANHLMQHFPAAIDAVKMRVGALPINISNALQYSLTWSIDGLINEYGNPCYAIEHGKETLLLPLDDLEEIKIDGLTYEAFNTSGGIGSLATTYGTQVNHLSYKTIRYPGHCHKMRFLMKDLKLNQDRDTLKRILENAIPRTYQDVVLVYVSVTGRQHHQFIEENYVKKFYPQMLHGLPWSAIQMTTASSLCFSLDTVLNHPQQYQGFVRQEQFALEDLLANRFGKYYA